MAVFVAPASDADIVAVVFDPTFVVVTVNVAEVLPAAIVTVAGAVAADWLLDNAITRPPTGAEPLILTVPEDDFPPATLAGLSVSEIRVGGLIVSVAF